MSEKMPTPEEALLARSLGLELQPEPTRNNLPSVHDLVIEDLWAANVHSARGMSLDEKYDLMLSLYIDLIGSRSEAAGEMEKRKEFGLKKYGTILQPFNGRNARADAIDEVGDAVVYLRTEIYEENNKAIPPGMPYPMEENQ